MTVISFALQKNDYEQQKNVFNTNLNTEHDAHNPSTILYVISEQTVST
jgi:hypothetical protein